MHLPMTVSFESGSAALDARARGVVVDAAEALLARNDVRQIRVEAHRDYCGAEAVALAEARAAAAGEELVRLGIPPAALNPVGYPEPAPRLDYPCERGGPRPDLRRVEFSIRVCADGGEEDEAGAE